MDRFNNFTGMYIDNYKSKSQLIQAYDYHLNLNTELYGEKIVIYCYNLYLTGELKNYSGKIIIFCKNIVCESPSTINVSGKDNTLLTSKKGSPTGENRNGIPANNRDDENNLYYLDGDNGGSIDLYAENIAGNLTLISNGGNGANGQDGGDALNGLRGSNGAKTYFDRGNQYATAVSNAKGKDGQLPTTGGNGAKGGNGGKGGNILTCINYKESEQLKIETFGGKFGLGGLGGSGNFGGIGGTGGEVYEVYMQASHSRSGVGEDRRIETRRFYGENGKNYLEQKGENGKNGHDGNDGENGLTIELFSPLSSYIDFAFYLPIDFYRSLILKGEDFYLNNKTKEASETFEWLIQIEYHLKTSTPIPINAPSEYYTPYKISDFEPYFDKAKIYLNQILQGADFFGNNTNYVTLLDESFIDNNIIKSNEFIKDYENLFIETLQNEQKLNEIKELQEKVREAIILNIKTIKEENNVLIHSIEKLNEEIKNRMFEVELIKKRIEEKEVNFRNAVNSATNGCGLSDVLNSATKIVSIAVAVSSGIGAIGTTAAILSGTSSLVDDFTNKIDAHNPGFDSKKWKEMFEDGKNDDKSKDTSLVNQVKTIGEKANDFKKNVNSIQEAINSFQTKKTSLVGIPEVDLNNSQNKQKFIEQMKDFINEFEEARIYQEEVLFFFDFCDITNQKRLQFTNYSLNLIQNSKNIIIYENDLYKVNSEEFKLNHNRLTATAKNIIVDSYFRIKNNYIKLLYLQHKSINYLTLENRPFTVDFYNGQIAAIDSNYISNKNRLIESLNNNINPDVRSNIDYPFEISENTHPITFNKLKESKFPSKDNRITFYFNIPNDSYGLDLERELKLRSVRVYFIGAKTNSDNIYFSLRHCGNSTFVTTRNKKISFNHYSIIKPLKYNLKKQDEEYPTFFNETKSKYYNAEIKKDSYVGVSPFANWTIYIPDNSINKGLDLSELEKIQIVFGYECKSEEHY